MRCVCCNRLLNNFESTRKSELTGEYLDTCNKCLDGLNIATVDRNDLSQTEEVLDDISEDDDEFQSDWDESLS